MTNQQHEDQADVLVAAAILAAEGALSKGEATIAERWPHRRGGRTKRSATELERLRTFLDDGFCCRYTGDRLFFTPLLEALSVLWPDTFPTHSNWKTEETHDAYWSHTASLDHVEPVSIGGKEIAENWVTTSGARNMVRSRFSLESLRWAILPRLEGWDGGVSVFLKIMERHRSVLEASDRGKYLMKWERIAQKVTKDHLVAYCRENGRVCPQPTHWHHLWELLPDRKRVGVGWEPAPPLILAAWVASDAEKVERLREHLEWADKHGILENVASFLRRLREEDWHHIGE